MSTAIAELLGADGPLAQALPGFAPRETQQAMAEAVEQAIAERSTLLVEAGTGTGKTFAYLLPALQSGRKVLIATGTRALQDQLFHRDLPTLQRALGLSVHTALLKGRANYLCHHRLERVAAGDFGGDLALHPVLAAVQGFADRSPDGDLDALEELSPQSSLRPFVTSNADNCLGQDCPNIGDCFLLKARRAAQQADLVVVNHHLFFADLALKESGFGEVLPDADVFIFDEAHLLPEVATMFFGTSLGSFQLADLARDLLAEAAQLGDVPDLPPRAQALSQAAAGLNAALGDPPRREPWPLRPIAVFTDALAAVRQALADLSSSLEALSGRSSGLDNCQERVALLARASGAVPDRRAGRPGALDRRAPAFLHPACQPGRRGAAVQRALPAPCPGLRVHLRHAGGGRAVRSLRAAAGACRCAHAGPAGQFRLPDAGAAVSARRSAGAIRPRLHGRPGGGGAAGAARQSRPGLHAVHQSQRAAAGGHAPAQLRRIHAAGAGRATQQRAAGAVPARRGAAAAGHRQLLAGRGRARRGAVVRHRRQAAVRLAGRAHRRRAHRLPAPRGRRSVQRLPAAAGGDHPQARPRPSDPRRAATAAC